MRWCRCTRLCLTGCCGGLSGRRVDRPQQEQIEAEGDATGGGGLGLEGPVDGVEDIGDGGGVEVGGGSGAAMGGEGEVGGECCGGAIDAVAGGAAEFDEVVGGGDGEEEAAGGTEDAVELGGVSAGGDGEDEGEGLARVGDLAVGVGEDPLAVGIAAGGGEDGGLGDIDAVALGAGLFGEGAEVVAVAAAGVEDGVGGGGGGKVADGVEQGEEEALGGEAAAGVDCFGGVARVFGPAVLGLEEVDVAAAGNVEGVKPGAGVGVAGPGEGLAAAPDGTEEHCLRV